MATQFDRWEKDPFFAAAEEVQESADRMETIYRTWIHVAKDKSNAWDAEELRRDLKTALGTTKWQLEEFDRAVKSSYTNRSGDDAEHRHMEFVVAIDCEIKKVAGSLAESDVSQGKPTSPWVRLDKGERDELALFLTGPAGLALENDEQQQTGKLGEDGKQSMPGCLRNSSSQTDKGLAEANEDKLGHRRTASASADIGAWKIAVSDDVSTMQPQPPPRKIPSFSGFMNTMESAAKLKFAKNGYRKFKNSDIHHEAAEGSLPQTQPSSRGSNTCYERSKSCLNGCDKCYDKQLYGWHGTVQRQFQRSQYYMLYSRPVRVVFLIILLCLIGESVDLSFYIGSNSILLTTKVFWHCVCEERSVHPWNLTGIGEAKEASLLRMCNSRGRCNFVASAWDCSIIAL
nr:syntaxin-61-like [Ipomoea batatas]